MKILCSISGIEFDVQHMPGYLTSRESHHPIYDVPQKHLFSYLRKWSEHGLTDIDSYLLYTALFNSTKLIHWHSPAKRHEGTKSLVAGNMEALARAIGRINLVSHPSFVLHQIAIRADNADLLTSPHWIDNWNQNYNSFLKGYKDEIKHDKIVQRERSMDYMLKGGDMPIGKFARVLSEWAADVADFPTHNVKIKGNVVTLSDYWKSIIIKCVTSDAIYNIPEAHLDKLQEFCEEAIDIHGSSYGHALMAILRHGLNKINDPFDLDSADFDIKNPGFKILSPENNSVEAANKAAMILAAPKTKPLESEIGTIYPSKYAFLRAQARWYASEEEKKSVGVKSKFELQLEEIENESKNENDLSTAVDNECEDTGEEIINES